MLAQITDITNRPKSPPTKPPANKPKPSNKRVRSMTSMQRMLLAGTGAADTIDRCSQKRLPISAQILPTHPQGEDEVFTLAYQFFVRYVDKENQLKSLLKELNFGSAKKHGSISSLDLRNTLRSRLTLQPSADMMLPATSMEDIHAMYKRISIASLDELASNNSLLEESSTSVDPETTFISEYRLSRRIVKRIYENPSAFLIIHSICLLLKYLSATQTKLTSDNVVKLIAISAIISYKINYDQEINGINSYYGTLMNFESKEITLLERRFLTQIGFETNVDKFQYYLVSEKVMGNSK